MSEHIRFDDLTPATLQALSGAGNEVLRRLEEFFAVKFFGYPGDWQVEGERAAAAVDCLHRLLPKARRGPLDWADIETTLRDFRETGSEGDPLAGSESSDEETTIVAGRRHIRGKTRNQRKYLETIERETLTVCVGPAGSGKTYLAVAMAVVALLNHRIERIILTRPAVEAGERLGFLPGDLQQKVDPYLRPLFDALADMLGMEKMNALMETGRIEVAPLAFMRGRTLNDAFIILDEAQNSTREQMKMFVTRLGFGSKMVITGDVTQIDLEQQHRSGLMHALTVLAEVEGVGISRLSSKDVVRHRLVERIVTAYDRAEGKHRG